MNIGNIIQRQVEAYQHRDLKAFCSFYSEDIKIFKLPSMDCVVSGIRELNRIYSERFKNPYELEILDRKALGDFVMDHEKLISNDGSVKIVFVIYHVQNSLIQKVWIAEI